MVNFYRTELALHKNGVEFRQQFNCVTRTSLTTPMSPKNRNEKSLNTKLKIHHKVKKFLVSNIGVMVQ